MLIGLVVAVVVAQPSGELFQDKGEFFIRAGRARNLQMGAQLKLLGDFIANTGARRTAGKVTVVELWPELSRVSLDASAQASVAALPEGQTLGVVELPDAVEIPEATVPHVGSFYVDPLGFLTFGPAIGLEFGGGRVTGAIYGRWFSAGLLSVSALLLEGQRYDFSFGLGGRMRFYFRDGFSGFHLGFAAEWLRPVVEDYVFRLIITSNYLVPQIEAGYRWGNERLFIGLAGSVGISARLFWKLDNMPGGTLASELEPKPITAFFASAKLELGVYF